jgi:tripartite-type tricarboxylate transporter receptor subunit TctC
LHITVPLVAPYIKEGMLRPLAVASLARSPAIPDVPTLEEAGVPGHEIGYWFGALVPAGTPTEIVELLQRHIAAIVALPEIRERLAVLGFDPVAGTSEEFKAYIKTESDKWRKVVDQAHIKIE